MDRVRHNSNLERDVGVVDRVRLPRSVESSVEMELGDELGAVDASICDRSATDEAASPDAAPPVATDGIETTDAAAVEGNAVPAATSDDHELGAALEPVTEAFDGGVMAAAAAAAAPANGARCDEGGPLLPADGDIHQALHAMLDEAGGSLDGFGLSMNEVRDKLSATFGVDMRPKKAVIKDFFEKRLQAESGGTDDPEEHQQRGSDVEAEAAASDDDSSSSDEESADQHVPGEQDGCDGRARMRQFLSRVTFVARVVSPRRAQDASRRGGGSGPDRE